MTSSRHNDFYSQSRLAKHTLHRLGDQRAAIIGRNDDADIDGTGRFGIGNPVHDSLFTAAVSFRLARSIKNRPASRIILRLTVFRV